MLARVHSRVWARISAAMHGHSVRCRRLHSRAEGGEPRREHYAVHLAFSLINGGGAGRWMPALLHSPSRLCSSSPYFFSPPLSFSLSCYFFHLISPFHLPFRDEIVLISSRMERILFLTIVLTNWRYLIQRENRKLETVIIIFLEILVRVMATENEIILTRLGRERFYV